MPVTIKHTHMYNSYTQNIHTCIHATHKIYVHMTATQKTYTYAYLLHTKYTLTYLPYKNIHTCTPAIHKTYTHACLPHTRHTHMYECHTQNINTHLPQKNIHMCHTQNIFMYECYAQNIHIWMNATYKTNTHSCLPHTKTWLRVLLILPEDLSVASNTHVWQPNTTAFLCDLTSFSELCRHYTDVHVFTQGHIEKILKVYLKANTKQSCKFSKINHLLLKLSLHAYQNQLRGSKSPLPHGI